MLKPVVDGLAAAWSKTTEAGRLLARRKHAADGRLAPVHARLGKGHCHHGLGRMILAWP